MENVLILQVPKYLWIRRAYFGMFHNKLCQSLRCRSYSLSHCI